MNEQETFQTTMGINFTNFDVNNIQEAETINVVFVIDKSSSTNRFINDLNNTLNEFLHEFQRSHVASKMLISVIEFNDKIDVVSAFQPISDLKDFNVQPYGCTNLYGAVLGFSKKFLDEKLDEIIEFSELGKFIDVPVKNYSSGMKSRLGFSVATLVEPDILILDEVLSVGDAKFRKKSEAKIMSMFDKGVTVLFVSHSLDQVKRLCNKAILLEKGKIISHGSIEEVSKVYEEKTK